MTIVLETDLPRCLCEAFSSWESKGGQFGGLCQSNFKCSNCGRFASYLSDHGGNLLLIVRQPGGGLSERVSAWFDGVVQGVWRDNYQRFEQRVKEAVSKLTSDTPVPQRNVAAMELAILGAGGPMSVRVFKLLVDPATEGTRGTMLYALLKTVGQWEPDFQPRVLCEKTNRFIDDKSAPKQMDVLHKLAEGEDYESSECAREILRHIEDRKENKQHFHYGTGLPEAPIPPRIPGDEIAVWLLRGRLSEHVWRAVDPAETQELPVPPDPIRVRHDAYFKEVFEAVGLTDTPRTEIPNTYYRDTFNKEPWYEFEVNGFKLVIGPRKRVISMSIARGEPFDPSPLTTLGERDNVTYDANGGWKSKDKQATSAMIHAWNKDKTVEYLRTILQITECAA